MNGTTPIFPPPQLLRFVIHDIKQVSTPIELLHSFKELLQFQHHDSIPVLLSATPFLVLALIAILTYKFLIYPIYLSPLSRIPSAHPLAAITPLWMDYRRLTGQEVSTTYAAFQKYGPFVRLGPNEVAVNTITGGVTAAHGHGFQNLDKTSWYNFFINFSARNTFSALGKEHGNKRKRVTNVYAESYVQNSRHIRAILSELVQNRLLPSIGELSASNAPIDILAINFAYGLDFVAAFIFGLSRGTDFLRDSACRQSWLDEYRKSHPSEYMFWLLEHPRLIKLLAKLGMNVVVPTWYHKADTEFDKWGMKLLEATEKDLQAGFTEEGAKSGDMPNMYFQLKKAMADEDKLEGGAYFKPNEVQKRELASECLDHLVATRDTFGVAFSFILLELSKHPYAQTRLRAELRSLKTPLWHPNSYHPNSKQTTLPSPDTLKQLPYLCAVIKESIRLRGTVPTPNPRITPAGTKITLGPYTLPPRTRISAFAWCLHRNEAVFPQPELWLPDRWLNRSATELAEMEKWFWAFGSGSRACLGRNVAMELMRYALAGVYTNFETSVVDDEGFGYEKFVTGSLGNRLLLGFARVD